MSYQLNILVLCMNLKDKLWIDLGKFITCNKYNEGNTRFAESLLNKIMDMQIIEAKKIQLGKCNK